MIPALFRGSLWLAAFAAGAAALAPAGLAAWRSWRSGPASRATALPADRAPPPDTLQIDGATLHEVAARIGRLASSATSLDAALHDAANLLKSELGALDARVYRVKPPLPGAPAKPRITESIATRTGFHPAGELPANSGSVVAMAVRRQLPVLALPDALALPILCAEDVVAALALHDIAAGFDDAALHELLAVTARTLAAIAATAATAEQGAASPALAKSSETGAADESQFPWSEFDGTPQPNPQRLHQRDGPSPHMLTRRTPLHAPAANPAEPAEPAELTTGSAGPVASAGVLDPAALARLAELDPTGTSRLLPRVLTAYVTSVARLHPQFVAARPQRDFEAIRHVAHTLKSSSASIGAIKLSGICAEIDNMIRTADTASLGPHLDSMDAELDRVLKAVKHLLGGHP